jgi:hypothetical protein
MTGVDAAERRYHWLRPTPDRFVVALVLAEFLLWLSDWLGWPPWHKGYGVLACIAVVTLFFLTIVVWFGSAMVFRRSFQFSLRSLLLFVIAAALPFSWLAVEMRKETVLAAAAKKVADHGGSIFCDWDFDSSGAQVQDEHRPVPMWLRSSLGDGFFTDPVEVSFAGYEVTDDVIDSLQSLRRLKAVCLGWGVLPGDSLLHLQRLDQLRALDLSNNDSFTDAYLDHLEGLTQLIQLDLSNTLITDNGLKQVAMMRQLQVLDIGDTSITDAGLEHIQRLDRLRSLNLERTQVSSEGVAKLQQVLPNCRVTQ